MKENKAHLCQEQLDKLKQFGSRLQQAREAKFLSLEDVARKTLIPERLLRAIEEGNRAALPESVYIQGLLKQFGDHLGLNGTKMAKDFPEDSNFQFLKPSLGRFPKLRIRPVHWYALYVAVVVGTVSSVSNYMDYSQAVADNQKPEKKEAARYKQKDTHTKKTSGLSKLDKKQSEDVQNQPVTLDVTVEDQSWLRVVADGKTKFEGTVKEGKKHTWEAQESITLLAGNAGGVLVAYNQNKAKKLGKLGQIQEVTYPPQL